MSTHIDRYRKHLAGRNLSEAEENAILEPLWRILEGFTDCAWGLDPVQSACGQFDKNSPKPALTAPNEVECLERMIAHEFMKAAETQKTGSQRKADDESNDKSAK